MHPPAVLMTLRDQRGMALPLAMMILVLLTSLVAAFVAMSATEPLITANLKAGDEALGLAEAGVERTIWGLDHVGAPPAGASRDIPAPAPYNATQLIALGRGGYTMNVTAPPPGGWACATAPFGSEDRCVVSTGYVVRANAPVPASPGAIPQGDLAGRRMLQVALTKFRNLDPPGPLNAYGSVQMKGNSNVDGAAPQNCPPGTLKAGVTVTNGNTITTQGAAQIIGSPAQQSLDPSEFNKFLFSYKELDFLKQMAQSGGPNMHYIKPTSSGQLSLNMTNMNGLVFVDTVNGIALPTPPAAPKATDLANVKITGLNNQGWLVVMGSLTLDGNINYQGLVYTLNDLSYRGTGGGGIYGAVISQNIVDPVSSNVDTDTLGNANVTYDCAAIATGGGLIPQGYYIAPGSWREASN
ncbi:MAG TPA: pilus assembly PilX N-terminal domain-containing protein [Methylomirabilota bacterium]|nr:pilus assembly PilX N-terminal domain-containing protein [Methylomirabilota bacterium]